jgi:hypothetical protein
MAVRAPATTWRGRLRSIQNVGLDALASDIRPGTRRSSGRSLASALDLEDWMVARVRQWPEAPVDAATSDPAVFVDDLGPLVDRNLVCDEVLRLPASVELALTGRAEVLHPARLPERCHEVPVRPDLDGNHGDMPWLTGPPTGDRELLDAACLQAADHRIDYMPGEARRLQIGHDPT